MVRRPVKPQIFSRNPDHFKDYRLSVCTNCSTGIFADHKYVWSSKGLIHIDCNDKVGVNALEDVS